MDSDNGQSQKAYIVFVDRPGRQQIVERVTSPKGLVDYHDQLIERLAKGKPLVFAGDGARQALFPEPGLRLVVMTEEEANRRQHEAANQRPMIAVARPVIVPGGSA